MTVSSFFHALVTAGLPLFLLSFALVSLALHRGSFTGSTVKEVQNSMDTYGKAHKKNKQGADPALGQWLRFGGGFYGLVALYTWLLIEWDDVANFISGLANLVIRFELGAIISLLIELFIESIMNFVQAIAWPAYWLRDSGNTWMLMLAAAYTGYWLGIKAAQHAWREGWVAEAIERLAARLRRPR